MNTGVYAIRNKVNGKVYIGSAASGFSNRWRGHRSDLKLGKHHSILLQRAWAKYGADCFEFIVLTRCPADSCIEQEQQFIDFYHSANPENGYNIAPTAGSSLGVKLSEETRNRISAAVLARFTDPIERRKHGEIQKRRFSDPEQRRLTGEKTKAALATPERRAKLSANSKSRLSDPEYKHRVDTARAIALARPETRAKMSASAKRRPPISTETLARISAASRARPITKETRKKMAASARGKKRSDESKARMRAARLKYLESIRENAASV